MTTKEGVFACRTKILVRVTVVGILGDLFPNEIKKEEEKKVMEIRKTTFSAPLLTFADSAAASSSPTTAGQLTDKASTKY